MSGSFSGYRVTARNTAAQSENAIHDDAVARRYGFRGGLVPGVTVYAYLTHPLVEGWGREWLARGTASVRLSRPVLEGEVVSLFEKKGREFVEVDLLIVAGEAARPVAHVVHTAIYRLPVHLPREPGVSPRVLLRAHVPGGPARPPMR